MIESDARDAAVADCAAGLLESIEHLVDGVDVRVCTGLQNVRIRPVARKHLIGWCARVG